MVIFLQEARVCEGVRASVRVSSHFIYEYKCVFNFLRGGGEGGFYSSIERAWRYAWYNSDFDDMADAISFWG